MMVMCRIRRQRIRMMMMVVVMVRVMMRMLRCQAFGCEQSQRSKMTFPAFAPIRFAIMKMNILRIVRVHRS